MTMQAGPFHPDFIPFSEADLQLGLIERYRQGEALRPRQLAWSAELTPREVLTHAGFLRGVSSADSPELSAEGLLLFGKNDAISRFFPFLKTTFSLREAGARRVQSTELPLNLIEAFEEFSSLVCDHFAEDHGNHEPHHASRTSLVLRHWFLNMAQSRDYQQIRPARFAREKGYLFLEYPKKNELSEEPTPPLIASVISAVFPTMQADIVPETLERACFGTTPIRIEGRFFKIMAPIPLAHSSETIAKIGVDREHHHASSHSTPFIATEFPTDLMSPVTETMQVNLDRVSASEPNRSESATATMQARLSDSSTTLHQPGQAAGAAKAPKTRVKPVTPTIKPDPSPTDRTTRILKFCQTPRDREEIQLLLGMNNRDHFRKEVLNKLIAQGLIRPTLPDKPNSPHQQYVTVG